MSTEGKGKGGGVMEGRAGPALYDTPSPGDLCYSGAIGSRANLRPDRARGNTRARATRLVGNQMRRDVLRTPARGQNCRQVV